MSLLLALLVALGFRFHDPAITEASALVDLGDTVVTSNDSGDTGRLFVVDHSGRTLEQVHYADSVVDVEALAPAAPGFVWVGDIGDNRSVRPSVRLFRVSLAGGPTVGPATSVELVYPDGPHDAESLINARGRLYVVTKGVLGGGIYAVPRHPSERAVMRRVGSVSLWATDAAAVPGTDLALVRGYDRAVVVSTIGWRTLGSFPLPSEQQGEAISVGPGGRVLITSEGVRAPVTQVHPPAWLGPLVTAGRLASDALAGAFAGVVAR